MTKARKIRETTFIDQLGQSGELSELRVVLIEVEGPELNSAGDVFTSKSHESRVSLVPEVVDDSIKLQTLLPSGSIGAGVFYEHREDVLLEVHVDFELEWLFQVGEVSKAKRA